MAWFTACVVEKEKGKYPSFYRFSEKESTDRRNSFCQRIFQRDILLSVNLPEGYSSRRLTDISIFFCHLIFQKDILSEGNSSVSWSIRRIYFCHWIFQKDTLLSVDLPEGHHFQNRCKMQKDSAKWIFFCIYEDR